VAGEAGGRPFHAWATLAVCAAAVAVFSTVVFSAHARPLLDRRTCVEEPSAYTIALDRSLRGDALYRFVYATLFGLGGHGRAGFPHVGVAPVCTLGWKDPVAAIRIGERVFLVTFDGAHVASVKGNREADAASSG